MADNILSANMSIKFINLNIRTKTRIETTDDTTLLHYNVKVTLDLSTQCKKIGFFVFFKSLLI